MASRRMLATSISVSEQVAALHDDFTRLLFTWMIAHADDWGVLTGSAAKVKALVIPMSDHSTTEVEAALADMEAHELIWRYNGPDGRPWVQFRTWEEHQQGLHKRTAPKVPRYADVSGNSTEPTGYTKELPGSSGAFRELPSEQNRTELEEKRRESARKRHANVTPMSRPPRSEAADAAPSHGENPLWDVLVEVFHQPKGRPECSRFGKVVKDLKDLSATPEDVRQHVKNHRLANLHWTLTPESLISHWGEFERVPVPSQPRAVANGHERPPAPVVTVEDLNPWNGRLVRH